MGHKNRQKVKLVGVVLIGMLVFAGCKHLATRGASIEKNAAPPPVQISANGIDAAEPAIVSAGDGTFYVAWVNHDAKQADVMLARFNNTGEIQGSAIRVNRQPGTATAWRGDQPSLAVAPNGGVHVLWTTRVDAGDKHGTDVYLSSSTDRGQSFATEVKVNDDKAPGPHGMHSLAVAADGRIYAAWLDERNVHTPMPSTKGEGHHMESNRDVFVAYSTDGGRSFSANKKVASDACPCCKTALTVSPDGTLYAGWRQVLPGSFRHIAVAGSNDGGNNFSAPVIVSDDHWVLQGCPVSGPSLSVDRATGNLKVVWYAAGEGSAAGVYFAESKDKGHSFSPRQLLAQETVRGTPVVTGAVALWQTSETGETKMRSLGNAGSALSLATNAELPAGTYVNDKLFVAYIGKEKEKRSIWLIRAGS
ncbi:MAG TPA: sialidase family protein [Pyrinomonadaceae bacterium]|nr:sialidase family protein [Pyrinomonadaceae bacterium]